MLLLHAIQSQRVRLLWLGQVFSAMGDEIYRVAFVWMAVQMVGHDTGYLSSLQHLAAILMSLFGVRLVDRLQSERAMMRLDFLRFGIVLVPVALYLLGYPSFWVLAGSSLLVAGLGALFEPALMETIPKVAGDPKTLKGANGLMGLTFRLARVMGPAVVGVLAPVVPMIHFFTIDALTYLGSAYSIHAIGLKQDPKTDPPPQSNRISTNQWGSFAESWMLIRHDPSVFRAMMAKSVTGGAWGLAYGVGLALLAEKLSPGDVSTFGIMMSVYGIGNVIGAVYFGNLERKNPETMIFTGLLWLGVTFTGIATASSLNWTLLFIGLSAIGGPWNDLPFVDLVQQRFKNDSIGKIFRVRNVTETTFQLVFMVLSPLLFNWIDVRGVLLFCAAMMFFSGVWGLSMYKKSASR